MPRRATPAGKQRVRTGCLTCRRRRRKCDEQKPRCVNCESKGFVCKYGADLSFVSPRSAAAGGTRRRYSTITFVDDSPAAHAAAVKERSCPQQISTSDTQGNHPVGVDVIDSVPSDHQPDFLALQHHQTPEHPIQGHLDPLLKDRATWERLTPAASNCEIELLRHFRYHVAPWIDIGDPDCALGVKVLLLSRTNRPLQTAILALSSKQRALLTQSPNNEDFHNSLRYRQEAGDILALQPDLICHAGQALLLLRDLLSSGLRQWRSLLAPHVERVGSLASSAALSEPLYEALFWFHFRFDLAASIVTSEQPITPFHTFLQRDGRPIHAPRVQSQAFSANQVYKHALCQLGHCLVLLYGDPNDSSPEAAASLELAGFPSLQQSRFLSRWTLIWTDCQKWYRERPVDAQQIVDVRGGEADQIDPDHISSFPILIYTTPMALVANAVYHATSFLLLTHKPRLLKSLPGPRCFTSHIWHAQCIAGIAASNDSPEQWDPIFIASLLLIARGLTHRSQQAVLLDRLRSITTTTGISLKHETEALESAWRMSIAQLDELDQDEFDAIVS
ncbi:hypothetical protein BDV59DRAFT_191336 [Aspergillus ambiguus]|uniref:uncharacterized protein n=1 Tax=Aspergillus ambiguus TaxID=176160 RepID=UPI003CCCD41C